MCVIMPLIVLHLIKEKENLYVEKALLYISIITNMK